MTRVPSARVDNTSRAVATLAKVTPFRSSSIVRGGCWARSWLSCGSVYASSSPVTTDPRPVTVPVGFDVDGAVVV